MNMKRRFEGPDESESSRRAARRERNFAPRIRHGVRLIALSIALITCGLAARGATHTPDKFTVRVLPSPGDHWIFVGDPFSNLLSTRLYAIDGASHKLMGMLTAGELSTFEISPDRSQLYSVDTFYSRLTRGDRTDVVTIYDSRRLEPVGEVAIPAKRLLSNPKRYSSALTPDGRFLLVANETPANSVSVVDLKARQFVTEIGTPGCNQVLIAGNRRFAMLCVDGALLTVTIDEAGKAASRNRGKPFFDVEKDPVFDCPALHGAQAYFLSYHGQIYHVDLSRNEPAVKETWPVLTASDREEHWLPGGWQPMTAWLKGGLLFTLMHQGGKWSHEESGSEVWIFDAHKHARIDRFVLAEPADSLAASHDAAPLLYAAAHTGTVQFYSALKGRYLGKIGELGSPYLLYAP